MTIRFVAIPLAVVEAYRRGEADANAMAPERGIAATAGLPCRCCLRDIEIGAEYLTLAHRPFPAPQPYAEIGPIFLHATACRPGGGTAELPPFLDSPSYIVRGYGFDDRIIYGTGKVVATEHIAAAAEAVLADPAIAYVHVRSASNNCYHCRIERA